MITFLKNRIKLRRSSDAADSTAVSFILIMPLFFGILMTIIDTSAYFANRSIVQNLSRDSARQAAIFGGPGNLNFQSRLESDYGFNTCVPKNAATTLVRGSMTECLLENKLADGAGLINSEINSIECFVAGTGDNGANLTAFVGVPVYCDIRWTYGGIPGSVLSFIKKSDGTSPLQNNFTRVSAQSEVGLEFPNDVFVRTP